MGIKRAGPPACLLVDKRTWAQKGNVRSFYASKKISFEAIATFCKLRARWPLRASGGSEKALLMRLIRSY